MADGSHIEWTDATARKRTYDRERYLRLKAARRAERSPDPITRISDTELAYIAGLIDGEGSIYVMKHRDKTFYPAVSICMTHAGVLTWLADKLNLSVATVPRMPAGWRNQYSVRIHGARAVELCRRLLPYLKVKHAQALLLQDFPGDQRSAPGALLSHSVNERRRVMRDAINALNARGADA